MEESIQSSPILIPRKLFNNRNKLKNYVEKKSKAYLRTVISIEVFSENENYYELFNFDK